MSNTRNVLLIGAGSVGQAILQVNGSNAHEVLRNILSGNYTKLSSGSVPTTNQRNVSFSYMGYQQEDNILRVEDGVLKSPRRDFLLPTDSGQSGTLTYDCVLNLNVHKQANGAASKTDKSAKIESSLKGKKVEAQIELTIDLLLTFIETFIEENDN